MPESKKRKKEPKRKRRESEAPQPAASEPSGGGGFLSSMRGGIQKVAGTGAEKKKESWLSRLLTWALIAAALYFLARRFGILR